MIYCWLYDIFNYIPKISHAFNTRTKKESVVSSECLQTPEANIINNINSLYLLIMSRTCESTLCSCLNVKELLAWSRREIWSLSDCNWTRIQNHLVHKRAKWLSVHLQTKWFWVQVQLQSLNINSLKDEIISLKDTAIKRLQEENERLCVKYQQLENRVALIQSSHDVLEQYSRRNNLVISGIPDSIQDSDLESTVASILSDIDVNIESREVEECHRIGKSNNGSKKTIIRFVNRKYCKKALLNRKQLERMIWKKHQLVGGSRIFINENLTVKKQAFGFQL